MPGGRLPAASPPRNETSPLREPRSPAPNGEPPGALQPNSATRPPTWSREGMLARRATRCDQHVRCAPWPRTRARPSAPQRRRPPLPVKDVWLNSCLKAESQHCHSTTERLRRRNSASVVSATKSARLLAVSGGRCSTSVETGCQRLRQALHLSPRQGSYEEYRWRELENRRQLPPCRGAG